jgi:penicillin-insensitive murein endopeptidase
MLWISRWSIWAAFSLLAVCDAFAAESICYGTTSNGRLVRGIQLPTEGRNFIAYGAVPVALGRTYVHSTVRDIIVEAYRVLEKEYPDKVFKYAETGFKQGGKFVPHKTHRNGLSVDFMVPVVDGKGISVHLPTNAFNKYGYAIEFDAQGRYQDYRIDYEAMAAHIVALHRAAQKHGVQIWRVIFDPTLAPKLYVTRHGAYIQRYITIPSKNSWVRHDEHYHVDFQLPCKALED